MNVPIEEVLIDTATLNLRAAKDPWHKTDDILISIANSLLAIAIMMHNSQGKSINATE